MRPLDEDWQDSGRNSNAGREAGDEQNERKSFNPNFSSDNRLKGERRPRRRIGDNSHFNADSNAAGNGGQGGRYSRPNNGGDYNNDYRGGYNNNRGGYNNNRGGGYNRGGYNNNRGGGYNNNRGGYNNNRGYNNNGYDDNRNYDDNRGYDESRSYNNDRGGYNNDRGGYNNDRGGYNNDRGGYNNNRGGGYNNRGGYNNNRGGGYNNNRGGGYNNRKPNGRPQQQRPRMPQPVEYDIQYDPNEEVRLNKFLANAGVCSRREADQLIQAGAITVNGVAVSELGTKILRSDKVMINDQTVNPDRRVYLLLNKPKDCVTTTDDPNAKTTVMDIIKNACRERIYPVGRLDRNTTGVLLLTNDGDLAAKLTHPQYNKKKVYEVALDRPLEPADFEKIMAGIALEDGEIKADNLSFVEEDNTKKVGIEIHSGRNRIVRRIFEHLGYRVLRLDRTYFAGLTKKNLRRGQWRFLSNDEVNKLRMGSFE